MKRAPSSSARSPGRRPERETEPARRRLAYGMATAFAIGVGLASRRFPGLFPGALGTYPGDALWAMMLFFGLGVLRPGASIRDRARWSLGISFLVEFSQLYHAPWIDAVRRTTPGHLVLGFAFSWIDLLAYAVGVAGGAAGEAVVSRRRETA